jgi:hypothetical protein
VYPHPWFVTNPWSLIADFGYAAGLLTFIAFFMKDSLRLRQVAIVSNVFYAIYAADVHLLPTLILHIALFPVNCVRMVQIARERRLIARALATAEISPEWLTAFMDRRRVPAGTVLFRRGDPSDAMYFLAEGRLRLEELGIDLEPGALFGEMGLFAPGGKRTQTVLATMTSFVYVMRRHEAMSLYRRDPSFGIYLIRLITQRLVEDLAIERERNRDVTPAASADDSPQAARA